MSTPTLTASPAKASTNSAELEAAVILRLRELRLAHWTDSAVSRAQDIYDDAVEALRDAVNGYVEAD